MNTNNFIKEKSTPKEKIFRNIDTGSIIKDNNGVSNELMSPTSNTIPSKKSVSYLGDSMLKSIQGWNVTSSVSNDTNFLYIVFQGQNSLYK